ncbi:response regulator transcription factor [Sphingomonas nostoxanthinifaciens]|uniref:response regulator transcription factor n=1 Tax=Sphingomonas nostoxanthinifaciens TaxID=2872652 RepID=UPI001CC21B34|nr:response regulator transcription factor [Sphingomonas nostoxanthinifaciens]UAK25921.1 response regulator transcription factor [Sphingomonas nostoxanthinifaciens]
MRIFVAEDDHDTAELIGRVLVGEGHEVEVARTGEGAAVRLVCESFDVAILDRMLPGKDGMTVLAEVRGAGMPLPILMLTALGSIANRVEGLEAGADDYLTKPFAISELIARVNALQRRAAGGLGVPTRLQVGPIHMDILRREVAIGGRAVPLQPRELRLLEELMRNPGRVMTRAMLLEKVWGLHFEPQTNLVETHMSRLRSKLGFAGVKDLIETVRGSGYRLKAEA